MLYYVNLLRGFYHGACSLTLTFLIVSAFSSVAFAADESVQTIEGEYLVTRQELALRSSRSYQKPELIKLAPSGDLNLRSAGFKSRAYDSQVVQEDCEQIMLADPTITNCEPNVIWNIARTPNDAEFDELWGLRNTRAPEAWGVTQGSEEVIVAVLDTGVDHDHVDLEGNMWVNSGEIPGNGIDDDRNGYIDDINGYDFFNNDGNSDDDNGHGTHCAGTIGARGNNGIGITGVNWNVRIMGLKFLSSGGGGSTNTAIDAIDYAIEMGAKVINASFGGSFRSQALFEAIQRAEQAGVIFVAAAGNSSANNDTTDHYPSNFNLELTNVMSVAATDEDDELAFFSNFGARSVDVAAPGARILSTLPGNRYGALSGTSMAAPHVAGLAALMLANQPSLSASQVISQIINTSDRLGSLASRSLSQGRINMARSLGTNSTTPTPIVGGGDSEIDAEVRVVGFRSLRGASALKSGKRWRARVVSNIPQDVEMVLNLARNSGETLSCSLGLFNVSDGDIILRGGRLPKTVARKVTLGVRGVTAGQADSRQRRVLKAQRGSTRVKRRRLRNLEVSCSEIASRVRVR